MFTVFIDIVINNRLKRTKNIDYQKYSDNSDKWYKFELLSKQHMDAFEPKWVNSDYIWYRVNSITTLYAPYKI